MVAGGTPLAGPQINEPRPGPYGGSLIGRQNTRGMPKIRSAPQKFLEVSEWLIPTTDESP
jgi:hypothetical protein